MKGSLVFFKITHLASLCVFIMLYLYFIHQVRNTKENFYKLQAIYIALLKRCHVTCGNHFHSTACETWLFCVADTGLVSCKLRGRKVPGNCLVSFLLYGPLCLNLLLGVDPMEILLLFYFLLRQENVSAHYMKNNQMSPPLFILVCTLPIVCLSSLAHKPMKT